MSRGWGGRLGWAEITSPLHTRGSWRGDCDGRVRKRGNGGQLSRVLSRKGE